MPELGIRRKLLVRRMSRSSGLGNACSAVQGLSDGACCEPSGTLIISGCGTSRHAHHLGMRDLPARSSSRVAGPPGTLIISGCGTFRHAHHLGMRDLPARSSSRDAGPPGTLIISGCGTSRHAHHLGLPALTGESVRALERGFWRVFSGPGIEMGGESVRALERGFWRGFSGPGIEMPGKSPRRSSVAAGEVPRGRESRWLANLLGRSSTGSDGPARGRESRCRRISSGVRARLLANTLATACRAVRRDLWARFIISGCGTFRHAHHLGMRDLPEYSRCMGLPPVFMSGSRKCLHDVASVGRSVVV